ncbi:hypothetical protein CI610_01751 [invertebrate metagenome]|uniref:Uncharacterized protein n=1 Tax=invertebrate metagenome TaxID=1711999 RepID=A0A2H9T7T8_9ZZZZ
MGFFEALLSPVGKVFGGVQKAYDDTVISGRRARAEELNAEKKQQQQIAYNRVATLEQQRKSNPEAWGVPEQLQLYNAYGNAGIDPEKRLKYQQQREQQQLFQEAFDQIEDPVKRLNVLNKNTVQNVKFSGGTAYNPYDTENWYVGSTSKNRAEARQAQQEAELNQLRTQTVKTFLEDPDINPMLKMDAAQDKSVFKGERITVDDGKGNLSTSYAVLTPSGEMRAAPVLEKGTGNPLKIPTTTRTGQQYKLTRSPPEEWNYIYQNKAKSDSFGIRPSAYEVLTNSLEDWTRGQYGKPIPVDIKTMIKRENMTDKEKGDLLALVDSYEAATEKINQPAQATVRKPTGKLPAIPDSQYIPSPLPVTPPDLTTPPPTPEPQAPPKQPLTTQAIGEAMQEISSGKPSGQVLNGLEQQGYDLSQESIGLMAVNAVNQGVPPEVIQQYFSALGIQWNPGNPSHAQ